MFADCLLKTGKQVFLSRLSEDHSIKRQAPPKSVISRFVPAQREEHHAPFNLGTPFRLEDPERYKIGKRLAVPP